MSADRAPRELRPLDRLELDEHGRKPERLLFGKLLGVPVPQAYELDTDLLIFQPVGNGFVDCLSHFLNSFARLSKNSVIFSWTICLIACRTSLWSPINWRFGIVICRVCDRTV